MAYLFRLSRRLGPAATICAALLVIMVIIGLIEPWLPGAAAKEVASGPRRAAPSAEFLFGSDNLGRSVLARVMEGIRLTFLVSSASVLAAGVVGALIGMIAAYFKGWIDVAISGLTDVLFAFPAIILGLLIAAILGPGTSSAVVAIFLIVLPTMIRVARGAALSIVERDFVVAAQISGLSPGRIILRHLAPNIASVTVVQMAYLLSIGMIIESGLSFLGLGVQPPASSLGALLRENVAFIAVAPWVVIAPGAVLSLAIFCVNFLGDAARGIIEPVSPRALT
jgi:peptide/nickel transport system permease protein